MSSRATSSRARRTQAFAFFLCCPMPPKTILQIVQFYAPSMRQECSLVSFRILLKAGVLIGYLGEKIRPNPKAVINHVNPYFSERSPGLEGEKIIIQASGRPQRSLLPARVTDHSCHSIAPPRLCAASEGGFVAPFTWKISRLETTDCRRKFKKRRFRAIANTKAQTLDR